MNGSSIQPERAWKMVLDQLRMDMSKAAFDTWVSNTEFVTFEDGKFNVATPSAYGREWLASRLTSTVNRLLPVILNQQVEVQFSIKEKALEVDEDDPLEGENSISEQHPAVLSLQAEYQSIYDEIIQPDQVIVIPGYFLRYIPLLGLELAWMYVGFRQAAYEAGAARRPGKKFSAPSKKVAWYAGMGLRTFWRWVARPEAWTRLRGLVTQMDTNPHWDRGKDGRPHQTARSYRVAMTLPMTSFDERSLRTWLYRQLAQGKTPLAVLQTALETPVDELIPWPENVNFIEESTNEPHSVQAVLQAVCGSVPESQRSQFQELSDKLAQHLIPSKDLIFLTHYFVTHWLPRLGSGPGWFITLLRDRGYINLRTGEIRDEVLLPGGYAEAARCLGLKRVKTIWEWLKSDGVANFLHEIGRQDGAWEDAPRRFKVCMSEPMTDADQQQAIESLTARMNGANGTHNSQNGSKLNGANGTHKSLVLASIGVNGTHRDVQSGDHVGAIGTHNGVSGTHKPGANGTPSGASDTLKPGASDTLDWRDWHSLNTITLGLKHSNNTTTTPFSDECADAETPYVNFTKGVVGSEWDLKDLLFRNRVSAKNRDFMLKNGVTAHVFISWLLYATSPNGNEIRNPIAFTVSRLIQDPTAGAGNAYDQLAKLPANELAELLIRGLTGQSPWTQPWRTVMGNTQLSRLRALADQLGIPVPNSGYR